MLTSLLPYFGRLFGNQNYYAIMNALEIDNKEEVKKLAKDTNRTVAKASSVFPFQLFPDTVTVDQNKIDIIHKQFFWSKQVFTIFLEDLTNVAVSTGPFFATLKFEVRGFEENPEPVTFLWNDDAINLHRNIVGLAATRRKEIDISAVPKTIIEKHIPNIGKTHEDIRAAI